MESKFNNLRKKFEDQKHRVQLVKEFNSISNKWKFMIEHPLIFGGSGGATQNYLMPNGLPSQLYLALNDPSHVAVSITSGIASNLNFVVPYKLSFKIGYDPSLSGGPTKNSVLFIRDQNVVPASGGNQFPDPTNGNFLTIGVDVRSGSTPAIFSSINTSGFGAALATAMGASGVPLSSAIYTVSELSANALKINVFDGASFNSHNYFTIGGAFSTGVRNIAILQAGDAFVANDQTNTSYSIVPTVPW